MGISSTGKNPSKRRPGPRSAALRWVVLASAYISVVINVGFFYSVSKLFVDIRLMFGTTRAQTATIHSTAIGFGLGSGIIYGLIISRLGPRRTALMASSLSTLGLAASFFATSITFLVVSIGIVTAAGLACIYVASSAIVGQHFQGPSATLALTLLATGSSIGGTLYPYLIGYLLEEYGLRGTFLFLAGVIMQTIPAAALWFPPEDSSREPVSLDGANDIKNLTIFTIKTPGTKVPRALSVIGETIMQIQYADNNKRENEAINKDILEEVATNPHRTYAAIIMQLNSPETTTENGFISVLRLLRNKVFIVYAVSVALINAALTVFLIFVVDYFIDRGYTHSDASLGLLLVNVSSLVGRMTPALLLRCFPMPVFTPPILSTVLGLVSLSAISFSDSLPMLLALACVVGFSLGLMVTTFTVTTQMLVGGQSLASAIGVVFSLNGIANLVSGPVSGLIRDYTGSYTIPFLGTIGPMCVGLLLLLLTQTWHTSQQQTMKHSASMTYISKL